MQPSISPVPAIPSLRPMGPPPVDMTRFADAYARVREAFTPFAEAIRVANRRLALLGHQFQKVANDPVHIAGLEARYMVRAGLDPAYATAHDLDALVSALLSRGTVDEDDTFAPFITPENRRRLAVAAIRGWVGSYVKRGA